MSFALLLIASLSTPAPAPAPPVLLRRPHDEVAVKVTIDSAKKVVRVKAGPFHLPAMPHMDDHGMMDMGSGAMTPVYHFTWPVEGWLRGFDSGVEDSLGNKLPKKLMHHMIMINYDRRQLIYPAAERLWGAGAETGAAQLPRTIGVPLAPGSNLGLYIAWHNTLGRNLSGVKLRMTMEWMPRNQNPRPVDVLPLYMDVNLTVGGANEFDVPPGRSEKAYTFSVPVEGRLLGMDL